MNDLPYAEEIGHYWKTSRSDPDSWVYKTKRLIESHGGKITSELFGSMGGHTAFMLAFDIGEDSFRVTWPVLPSKNDDERAARVQAATLLYHDIKAKTISASVLGPRAAFMQYLKLPDGRVVQDVAVPELADAMPKLLTHKKD